MKPYMAKWRRRAKKGKEGQKVKQTICRLEAARLCLEQAIENLPGASNNITDALAVA